MKSSPRIKVTIIKTWKPQVELNDVEKLIGRRWTDAEFKCFEIGVCEVCTCGWAKYVERNFS